MCRAVVNITQKIHSRLLNDDSIVVNLSEHTMRPLRLQVPVSRTPLPPQWHAEEANAGDGFNHLPARLVYKPLSDGDAERKRMRMHYGRRNTSPVLMVFGWKPPFKPERLP